MSTGNDISKQFSDSDNCNENVLEIHKDPVLFTCPNCHTSDMTTVEKENSCKAVLSCLGVCLLSVVMGICNSGQSGGIAPAQSSTTRETYIHKCKSCGTEIGRFTSYV